jgi:hypothetical protein
MTREIAIQNFSAILLERLSEDERRDQLETMIIEDWSETVGWTSLEVEVRFEFENGAFEGDPNDKIYDGILLLWLKDSLLAASNEFLAKELKVDLVEGEPLQLEACPCCGRRSIEERFQYEICRVCWWEDDGQDNADAGRRAGQNYGISLTEGRVNFIQHGIYDPARTDLLEIKEEKEKYVSAREFQLTADGFLIEIGTSWRWESKGLS